MNNIEKYKKAVDNINASVELKQNTLNKIKEKKKIKLKKWIPSTAVILALVISITIYSKTNIDDTRNQIWTYNTEISKNMDLPTVDSEEKLNKMVKSTLNTNRTKEKNWADVEELQDVMEQKSISSTNSNADFSETNIQVQGVDEGDIVKTDGKYIYSIGENEVIITDIQDPNNIKKVASIPFERTEKVVYNPTQIYISDNKLIVINAVVELLVSSEDVYRKAVVDVAPTQSTTKILIYDVQDKENIKEERRLEIDGNYLSSRLIGKDMYLITNQNITMNSLQRYVLPEYKDSVSFMQTKTLTYDEIYYFKEIDNTRFMNIVSFNVDSNEEATVYSFLGSGNEIYASSKNLYIANRLYNYDRKNLSEETSTEIYKFNMQDCKLRYIGMTKVNGTLINQFAMDEEGDYFRIAVNNNAVSKENMENNLYIFDSELKQVGAIEGLAQGEKIYSVRFMQNRVYLVTYKTIDPLFVIDLTNPVEPKVLGELKIPGVSEYLHTYDETHLIGIGRNTEEKNGREINKGMKVSLFDVSDVENPIEQSSLNIGDNGTFSDVQYNHKALYFDRINSIIGFPIVIRENSKYFKGASFYKIDLENNGISNISRVSDNRDKNYFNLIERIIYAGDNTYTISKKKIIILDRKTLERKDEVNL